MASDGGRHGRCIDLVLGLIHSEGIGVPSAHLKTARLAVAFGFQARLAQAAINGLAGIDKAFDRIDGLVEHGLLVF